jgi:TolB protein
MTEFLRRVSACGFLFSAVSMSGAGGAPARPVGIFQDHTDVGAVRLAGFANYDETKQAYTLGASGTNMWANRDEFHFAWRKVSGDFVLQTLTEFVGQGVDPHRKLGILVRTSLDPHSPHINLCRHGDGLTSLQYRRADGSQTEEVRYQAAGPNVLQLTRRGNTYTGSVAHYGDPFASVAFSEVALGDSVYVGIYVCSHNNDVSEQAVFHNVRLVQPARDGFVPYREYIGSAIETLDLQTGHRRIIHTASDSLQAPNWTPDGRRLIYNHNGRIYGLELSSRTIHPIDTGAEVRNNNDHALSFDGTMLGISSGEVSTIFVLPLGGGAPRQITRLNPSYLHSWSPDGKHLVYTGIRDGNADIYQISVAGGEEQRLTDSVGLDDGSEYTPDGQWIYFNSSRSGLMQIWRMRPDGSSQEQITHDGLNNWFPHPSPDGKSLVFLSYGPEVPAAEHPFYKHVYIRTMPLEGGSARVVAYLYGGQGSINVNSWAPDSRSIAFVSNSANW